MDKKTFQVTIKQTIDIVLSLVASVLLIIPFILIFFTIKASSKGPAFLSNNVQEKKEKHSIFTNSELRKNVEIKMEIYCLTKKD